jgi:hypothetical protein
VEFRDHGQSQPAYPDDCVLRNPSKVTGQSGESYLPQRGYHEVKGASHE